MGTVTVSGSIGQAFASAPSDSIGTDAIQNVRNSIPPEIGVVDGIVNWLVGFSPLNEWVIKPFAGDWTAIGHGAQAWATVGAAMSTIEQTLQTFPGQIGDSWQGEAATAWKSANAKVASSAQPLSGECQSMSAACVSAINFAESIVTLVINIVYELCQRGEQIAEATSVPVVGEVVDAGEIAAFIAEAIGWAQQIEAAIQAFTELVASFEQVEASFSTSQSDAQELSTALQKNYTSAADSLEDKISSALGLGGAVMDDISKGIDLHDKLTKKSTGSEPEAPKVTVPEEPKVTVPEVGGEGESHFSRGRKL